MQRLSGRPAETAAPLMIEGNMRNGKYMMGFSVRRGHRKNGREETWEVSFSLPVSCQNKRRLIFRRLLDVIDDQNLCWCVLHFQFQAKLFLNCCE